MLYCRLSSCKCNIVSIHNKKPIKWIAVPKINLSRVAAYWCCRITMHHRVEALTRWGRVMHIYIGNLTIIGSDNDLPPGRRQAIIGTNAGILLIDHLGTHFSEVVIEIHTFSFNKRHLKVSSGKWWPFYLGLNMFNHTRLPLYIKHEKIESQNINNVWK